ncbi:hypothetical protein D7V94_13420 [Parablautia intestinalis]|uniref:Uncharacterized protein n=1 Tax=Parablautia intestinalis TaxID=2320100 RepID=A0A3A9AGE5_9FIRM|nr:hypothetical protein [Parablautia intestinalis]RKI90429.1 hypothetical protein D7V94_13420 [Parablautia intestinalis]
MRLFGREARVSIGKGGGSGFEIGVAATNGIPIHIKFSFEKSDVESPNTGKVTIWNLNKEHLAELEKQDCVVIVRAGYTGNLAQAFSGTVTHATTAKEGADQMTEIEVADGMVELRDSNVSLSYAEGTATDVIYQDIAVQMGLPLSCSPNALGLPTVLSNGYSFVGSAKNLLKRLTRMDGTSWSIQDGILQLTKLGEPISLSCYELNAGSGLIGMPKRVSLSASGGSGKGGNTGASGGTETAQLGWEVTYLMNLAIGVNSYVHVTSQIVTGYFRVQKISVEGDNYEGDWQCKATILEITGQGAAL